MSRFKSGTWFQMPKAAVEMGLGMVDGWVYTGICRHANNSTGVAQVGIAQLMRDLGISRRTVIRAVSSLKARKLIAVAGGTYAGRKGWNYYQILPPEGVPTGTAMVSDRHRNGAPQAPRVGAPQARRVSVPQAPRIKTQEDSSRLTSQDSRVKTQAVSTKYVLPNTRIVKRSARETIGGTIAPSLTTSSRDDAVEVSETYDKGQNVSKGQNRPETVPSSYTVKIDGEVFTRSWETKDSMPW